VSKWTKNDHACAGLVARSKWWRVTHACAIN
jgi:hypothetical protein